MKKIRISNGYVLIHVPDHPRADRDGYVAEHILLAEIVLRKPLPPRAVVHHVDGDTSNNDLRNLVICEDQSYHVLLHTRAKALASSIPGHYRRCCFCKQFDHPDNLYHHESARRYFHRECHNAHQREAHARRMRRRFPDWEGRD